jgi:L-methionine (R)-S-oxide reductase
MNFKSLLNQHKALMTGRWLTDQANTSAFLMSEYPGLNWVGFYYLEGDKLYLGPFQGKPACTEIALGRGVCGRAALLKKVLVVDNVHDFEDHIACDAASESEMVIPLLHINKLIGVLDIDSPQQARFDIESQNFFIDLADQLLKNSFKQNNTTRNLFK